MKSVITVVKNTSLSVIVPIPVSIPVVATTPQHKQHTVTGIQMVRIILREEGIRGLYSGLSANLIRGVGGTILLVGYDEAKTFFDKAV